MFPARRVMTAHATLPSGERLPALGMGTWQMGEHAAARRDELDALRLGLDLGMTVIDTAEMYGDGRAEELVGAALRGRRDAAFVVSKVYPHNASRRGIVAACERSLARLGTDRIDLYLLHWRGSVPLAETVDGMLALQRAGKIRHFGVSNLDTDDMRELWSVPGGDGAATDQVLYNLTRRGPEWDLLPWCRAHRLPAMAYSPVEQGRLLADRRLAGLAAQWGMTPAQAALGWLLAQPNLLVIPKASTPAHVRENAGARDRPLDDVQLAALDAAFPPPDGPRSLEML